PFRIAVQTVERVFAIGEDVERTRTERVFQARLHAAVGDRVLGELRLAGDHLVRWLPARPFLLPLDDAVTRPGKALAADADAVAHRHAACLDEIEEAGGRIDNDGAGRLTGRI